MDTQASFGGFIPLWILGAPLVMALFGAMMGPKIRRRDRNETHAVYPAATSGMVPGVR